LSTITFLPLRTNCEIVGIILIFNFVVYYIYYCINFAYYHIPTLLQGHFGLQRYAIFRNLPNLYGQEIAEKEYN
jgi:hypothetical protein